MRLTELLRPKQHANRIKNLFENIKQRSKQNYFSEKLLRFKYNHGSITRTGITSKKIPCYMHDSACRWFIVKKAKIF